MQEIISRTIFEKEHPCYTTICRNNHYVTEAGWIFNDMNNLKSTGNVSCHASMQSRYAPENVDYIYNCFIDHEQHQPYLQWITDEKLSPWKSVLDKSIILLDKAGLIEDILIHNKHNGFVTVNLFIAARIATEHKDDKFWEFYVKEGIQPDLACLYATYINKDNNIFGYRETGNWHRPFNPTSLDFKHFLNGEPIQKPESSIKKGKYNNVCNYIWGTGSFRKEVDTYFKDAPIITVKGRFSYDNDNPSKAISSIQDLRDFQDYLLNKYKVKD